MAEQKQPTSAREARGRGSFLYEVSPDLTVRIRRLDMTTVILENLIPFHLLRAAQEFEEVIDKLKEVAGPDGSAIVGFDGAQKALEKLDPKKAEDMLQFMRHYACKMVISPVIVMEDDGNPDHLPVTELTGDELMSIVYAHSAKEEPVVNQQQAEDFRVEREGERHDAPSVSPGEDLRTETKLVAFPDRDAISA